MDFMMTVMQSNISKLQIVTISVKILLLLIVFTNNIKNLRRLNCGKVLIIFIHIVLRKINIIEKKTFSVSLFFSFAKLTDTNSF